MGCQGGRGTRSRLVLCTAVVCGLVALTPAVAQADISIGDAFIGETNGTVTAIFTVTRQAGLLAPARSVSFETADGSARAPGDYSAVAGTVSFDAALLGATQTQQLSVSVNGDALDEADETFRVLISAAETITDGEATATIADDDPAPQVSVADAASASESAAQTSFEVRLSAPSGRDVAVSHATGDGSAQAGTDYTASFGRLTIPAGSTVATVDVSLINDTVQEPAEALHLLLSAPSSATVLDDAGSALIVDDDGASAPVGGAATSASIGTLAGGTRLGLTRLRLRRPATVLINVACPKAAGRCRGRLTLFTRPSRASKLLALRSERQLGRRTFSIPGGRSRTLALNLRRLDRRLLRRVGSLRVRAFAVVEDATGHAASRQVNGRLVARG